MEPLLTLDAQSLVQAVSSIHRLVRRAFVGALIGASPLTGMLPAADSPRPQGWKLVWHDEFGAEELDASKWAPCVRGSADWDDTMSSDPRCIQVKGGILKLNGFVNRDRKRDPSPFLTGGVTSQGKFEFHHGKLEVRACCKSAQGAWPAIWLLAPGDRWPAGGEIDIMEHLNFDRFIHQTVHTPYTESRKSNAPDNFATAEINPKGFNIYGVEWDADEVVFQVNRRTTFTYRRTSRAGSAQWPFTRPLFIILSMQIGGEWVGRSNPAHFPAHLEVDWIRVYRRR